MSWLFGKDKNNDSKAPTFHPVSSRFTGTDIAGKLEPKDLEWTCAGGFATETQTFYHNLDDGTFISCQVVHSSVGLWYPTVQFTFKLYNPATKETIWRSNNVNNFQCPPPNLDKRSCRSDQFTVTFKSNPNSDAAESYELNTNTAEDLQLSLVVSRSADAPGWKIGNGPKSGYSYYGTDPDKADGYVIHRFWPRTSVSGHIIYKGKAISVNGHGMVVHAIMGMRPNLIAQRWNFCDFQSEEHGGISAIQMELTTIDAHGRHGSGSGGVKVNIGSVVVGGKLVSVSAETTWPDETEQKPERDIMSRAFHKNTTFDPDTKYPQPKEIEFIWAAPSLIPEASGAVKASLEIEVGTPSEPKGLIEKINILAEVPAAIRAVISYVAGTKPFLYQWYNSASLKLIAPDALIPGASEGVTIRGYVFNEATFVSDS